MSIARSESDDEMDPMELPKIVTPRIFNRKDDNLPLIKVTFDGNLGNETTHFEFIDVPGNGHCLFTAVMKSCELTKKYDFKFKNQYTLRKKLIHFVQEGILDNEYLPEGFVNDLQAYVIEAENLTIEQWAGRMDCDAEIILDPERWGGSTELALLSLLLDVEIVSVANMPDCISFQSSTTILEYSHMEHLISLKGRGNTIFVYHHECRYPFHKRAKENLNHFAALLPVPNDAIEGRAIFPIPIDMEKPTPRSSKRIEELKFQNSSMLKPKDLPKVDKKSPIKLGPHEQPDDKEKVDKKKVDKKKVDKKKEDKKKEDKPLTRSGKPLVKKRSSQVTFNSVKSRTIPKVASSAKNEESPIQKIKQRVERSIRIKSEPSATRFIPVPGTPSSVLDRPGRRKLEGLATTVQKKHQNDFRHQEGWPMFTGFYVTINHISKNVKGNQATKSLFRERPQINVIAADKEAKEVFEETFEIDDKEEEFDVLVTTDPKEFAARHNED